MVGCENIFPSGSIEPSATESEIPPLHKSENLCKGEFRPAGGIERLRCNLAEEHILLKKLFFALDAEREFEKSIQKEYPQFHYRTSQLRVVAFISPGPLGSGGYMTTEKERRWQTMSRHSFVQISKLPDVYGRVDYISNPKRQEHLYATYSTTEPDFWKRLSEQAQFDFWKSNQKNGKCIEARELIIALPESLQQYNPKFLLRTFTERFQKKYGVQCVSALHHNKAMTNYHIHLIFADREALEQPEIKYATRNMFYDENGRHVRTKKEIMDGDKKIKPGCRIVPKGEVYEIRCFSERKEHFKEKGFLQEVKDMYTHLINECLTDEEEKLQVFDKSGPYLPTKKIGKNNPKAKEIEADNALRKDWNDTVDQVLIAGGTTEEVIDFKKEYVTSKVADSIRNNGNQPGIFATILRSAIEVLKTFYRFLMFRLEKAEREANEVRLPEPVQEMQELIPFDPAELQRAKAEYMHLQTLHEDLSSINRKIYAIEKSIKKLNWQLDKLEHSFADKVLHVFERKELRKKIVEQDEKLEKAREQLRLYPKQHGYSLVGEIEEDYRSAEEEYKSLLRKKEVNDSKLRSGSVYVDGVTEKAISPKNFVGQTLAEDKPETIKDYNVTDYRGATGTRTVPHGEKRSQRTSVLMKLAEKQSIVEENREGNRKSRSLPKRKFETEL